MTMHAANTDATTSTTIAQTAAGDSGGEPDSPAPVGVIEVDRFCDHCGYNLRTQPVHRDSRTAILLCRCPECGTFIAAGAATDAGRAWLGRLGTLLLMIWVFILIAGTMWVLVGLGALQFAHLESFTTYSRQQHARNINGQVVTSYSYERSLVGAPDNPMYAVRRQRENRIVLGMIIGGSILGGIVAGTMLSVFLWHWPRWAYRFALVVPFLLTLVDYGIWRVETVDLRMWGLSRLVGYAVLQCVGLAVGVRIGRIVVRGLLRALLPESLLGHLAFLWHVDGRKVPHRSRTE